VKRSTLSFIIDAVSFVDLLALIGTGVILRWVLPPGTGGLGRALSGGQGGEHIKELWGMSRHEWGTIHFWYAMVFVVLMAVHVVLHWTWIKSYVKSLFGATAKASGEAEKSGE
jgi:hypothetical protein